MKRLTLDPPVSVGGVTVAAICLVRLTDWRAGSAIGVAGDKAPVVVLLRQGDAVTALGLDGEVLDPAEVENLCPGALDRMRGT